MTQNFGTPNNTHSPADIKQQYESNPDTNAFSDADKLKLESIASGTDSDMTLDDGRAIKQRYLKIPRESHGGMWSFIPLGVSVEDIVEVSIFFNYDSTTLYSTNHVHPNMGEFSWQINNGYLFITSLDSTKDSITKKHVLNILITYLA